jgi:hypothetical protein
VQSYHNSFETSSRYIQQYVEIVKPFAVAQQLEGKIESRGSEAKFEASVCCE